MKQLIPVRLAYKNIPFDAKDAHPMAREIAIPLQEKFKELSYVNQ